MAAVFEKEVHYLLRSGPMLLTLIMPLFVLVVFRFGAMNSTRHSGLFVTHAPDMAFPAAVGYTLLMLTNLAYNNFGGDAGGIQFFYASPVSFREIVLAKNLTHASILAVEIVVAWIAVSFFYGPPYTRRHHRLAGRPAVRGADQLFRGQPALDLLAEKTGLLFVRTPARFPDDGADQPGSADFRRGRGSHRVLDRAPLRQFLDRNGDLAGVGCNFAHRLRMILNRMDGLARKRRETLVAELCRA